MVQVKAVLAICLLASHQTVLKGWLTSKTSTYLRRVEWSAVPPVPTARAATLTDGSWNGLGRTTNAETNRHVKQLNLDDDTVPYLQRQLLTDNKDESKKSSLLEVEGYVISKRGFGPSFCFFDISRRGVDVPVQAMMKRQTFENSKHFDGFMKSLVPGIRISITGPVTPTRNPGEAVILGQGMQIQKFPHNPQHVRKLIRLVSDGLLDASHIAPAAKLRRDELLEGIQQSKKKMDSSHPKVFNEFAAQILESLKEENENDTEYPEFTSNHKYTDSLPMAPVELHPPPLVLNEAIEGIQQSEQLSVKAAMMKHFHHNPHRHNCSKVEPICLTGWVQNRRRFRGSISTLEMVDEMVLTGDSPNPANDPEQQIEPIWKQRLKCIVHPDVLQGNNNTTQAEMLGQVLAPGSQVRIKGYIQIPTGGFNHQVPTLWVYQTLLLRSCWRPNVVQFLIEQVRAERFQIPEAARALQMSQVELERIVELDDLTKRQWESTEIARRLQRNQADLSLHMDPKVITILDEYEELRVRRPLEFVQATESSITIRNDFVSTAGSRWKRKKEPQLEWMTQQVEKVLEESYPGKFDNGKETLQILDVGGGKGYLANYLAQRLSARGYDVKILVVDVAEGAIHNGRVRTERRNLSDMVEYRVADASTVHINEQGMDLVVALHACGALTDVALGHAVDQQAAFVICPCCFRSNPELCVPVRKQQSSDTTAHSLVAVEEWLGVDAAQYDKLKAMAEVQGDLNLANRAIHTLCALRLSSVEQHSTTPMQLSIKTFPVAFSTRNFCLIGKRLVVK